MQNAFVEIDASVKLDLPNTVQSGGILSIFARWRAIFAVDRHTMIGSLLIHLSILSLPIMRLSAQRPVKGKREGGQ
jgi:hypothetical protein